MLFIQLIGLLMWYLAGAAIVAVMAITLPERVLKPIFSGRAIWAWVALLVALPFLHTWAYHNYFDTLRNRERVCLEIREIVELAKANPDDPSYAQELLERARGNYSFEACTATVALGEIGDAAIPVMDELADLMYSDDPYVSREAANSLENLGPRSIRVISRLEEYVSWRGPDDSTMFAVNAIGNLGKDAERSLPVLRQQLGKNDWLDEHLLRAIEAIETGTGMEPWRITPAAPHDDASLSTQPAPTAGR